MHYKYLLFSEYETGVEKLFLVCDCNRKLYFSFFSGHFYFSLGCITYRRAVNLGMVWKEAITIIVIAAATHTKISVIRCKRYILRCKIYVLEKNLWSSENR